jgi:hypothetical protein
VKPVNKVAVSLLECDILFPFCVSGRRCVPSNMSGNDGLRARYVPVSELPTTPMQQGAIAIIFLVTALSVLIWAVRIYYRLSKKQIGLGKFPTTLHPHSNLF